MQNRFIRCPRYKGRNFNLGIPSGASLGNLPVMPKLEPNNPENQKTKREAPTANKPANATETQVKQKEPETRETLSEQIKKADKNRSDLSKKIEKTAENKGKFGLGDQIHEYNQERTESAIELGNAQKSVADTVPVNMSRRVVYVQRHNFSTPEVPGKDTDPLINPVFQTSQPAPQKSLPPGWWKLPTAIGLAAGVPLAYGLGSGAFNEFLFPHAADSTGMAMVPVAEFTDPSLNGGEGVAYKRLPVSELASMPKELPKFNTIAEFNSSPVSKGAAWINTGKELEFIGRGHLDIHDPEVRYQFLKNHMSVGDSGISEPELNRLYENHFGDRARLPSDETAREDFLKLQEQKAAEAQAKIAASEERMRVDKARLTKQAELNGYKQPLSKGLSWRNPEEELAHYRKLRESDPLVGKTITVEELKQIAREKGLLKSGNT